MKRFLATTAILALSAGFAAAEVTLSGDARMGIVSPLGGGDTGFTSRARVKFSLSGESDGGLAFGASFRANNAGDASGGEAGDVYISTGGFKLSMGDVDGAAQAAVGQTDGVGLTGLGDMNEIAYIGAGGSNGNLMDYDFFVGSGLVVTGDPTALLEYTTGNMSIYASATQPSYTYDDGFGELDAQAIAVGATYSVGDYKLSAGYEFHEEVGYYGSGTAENMVLGADATFGAITMKARYSAGGSEYDVEGSIQDHTQWALSATYVADALSVTGFVSSASIDTVDPFNADYERDAYGIGAAYDLGGGASVVGGYAVNTSDDDSAFDLGLSFSF